jgi:hypothetical protein
VTCPRIEEILELSIARRSGNMDHEAESHVARCNHCKAVLEKFDALVEMQARHGHELPATADCLDDNDFAAYVDGRVADNRRDRIERHLAKCDRCIGELFTLYEVLTAVTHESRKTAVHVVLGLVTRGLAILSAPSAGFVHIELQPAKTLSGPPGSDTTPGVAWKQSVGMHEVSVVASRTSTEFIDLVLSLSCEDEAARDFSVSLYREGCLIESKSSVGPEGAVFNRLGRGQYKIEIASGTGELIGFNLSLVADSVGPSRGPG